MTQYLALLRGINVGGKNVIRMASLKTCFEKSGFKEVMTYIQSGNVIFKSEDTDRLRLTDRIEKDLSAGFNYKSKIVLLNQNQLETIINEAPDGFGSIPDKYRYDVIYLRGNLTPDELLNHLKIKAGVDTADTGSLTLYFSRLISRAAESHLTYLISLPVYQDVTIRNWNTTMTLFGMMKKK